jgi:deoxyribonuclease-4
MPERTNRIGRHLPTSGGLGKTLQMAGELGCETVQIFVSNPQGWIVPKPRPDAETFAEGSRKLGLLTVAHAKYLINLASPNDELRARSADALARELVAAGELGVELVVVHAGSHVGDGEEKGMDRLVGELDRVKELAASFAGQVAEPVVENSVGAGTQLCSSFDSLGEVARRAGVRVCVDTAHTFVAGYDLSAPGWSRRSSRPPSARRSPCCTSTTRKTSWEAIATGTER